MLRAIDEIAARSASDPRVQSLYDHITAGLSDPFKFNIDDLARLNVQLDAALEAYAHTNSGGFVLEEDWRYGYEERKPLLKLTLELGIASWFYVTSDLRYGRNRFNERDFRRDTADLPAGAAAVITPPDPNAESYAFPYKSWAYSAPVITNVRTAIRRTFSFFSALGSVYNGPPFRQGGGGCF
jgi:hypothetical protein